MTLVNSLPQIADVSGSLHLDDLGNTFALMSDNPTDDAQAVDISSTLSDSSVRSFLSKIDDSPESESFLDSPDLTKPVNSFLTPDNIGISDEVSDLDKSSNIALMMDEGTGLEEGMEEGGWGAQTVPLGNSAGSQGYRGIPAGTGSSGGVNPEWKDGRTQSANLATAILASFSWDVIQKADSAVLEGRLPQGYGTEYFIQILLESL
ncbi:hypothetical protein MMC29_001597 [Sticta canariensis]|nr:hypothetical protein [Sticta canariensis]